MKIHLLEWIIGGSLDARDDLVLGQKVATLVFDMQLIHAAHQASVVTGVSINIRPPRLQFLNLLSHTITLCRHLHIPFRNLQHALPRPAILHQRPITCGRAHRQVISHSLQAQSVRLQFGLQRGICQHRVRLREDLQLHLHALGDDGEVLGAGFGATCYGAVDGLLDEADGGFEEVAVGGVELVTEFRYPRPCKRDTRALVGDAVLQRCGLGCEVADIA